MTVRVGYCCINLSIHASTNHYVQKKTLAEPDRVREAVAANVADLERILRWNRAHGFGLFRLGMRFVPFASHPEFPYDWRAEHGDALRRAGALAERLGQRLSMHPGQFINPGSPDPDVVARSLRELRYAADVLDFLDHDDGVMVLHLGGAYDDRDAAMDRFAAVLAEEPAILRHLALENDERVWTAQEVAGASERLGVPFLLDAFHHKLNPGDLTLREALDLALPTWGPHRPKVHLSSQSPHLQRGAHDVGVRREDWEELLDALNGRDADVMLEAKGKEHAVAEAPEEVLAGMAAPA